MRKYRVLLSEAALAAFDEILDDASHAGWTDEEAAALEELRDGEWVDE